MKDLLDLKPEDVVQPLTSDEVVHMAKIFGAFWVYDYVAAEQGRVGLHPLLKSKNHGDGFIVSAILLEPDNICQIIVNQMAMRLQPIFDKLGKSDWICGVPKGATELGKRLGIFFGIQIAEMKKDDKGEMVLLTSIGLGDSIVVVDDIFTKGTGWGEAAIKIINSQPLVNIFPYDTVILNRGKEKMFFVNGVGNIHVLSVVDYEINDWEADNCPLCVLGSTPIKPKETKENWENLISSQL